MGEHMNRFDKVCIGIAALSLFVHGCCNIGCKYDLRKYPTPLVNQQGGPGHIWNPECASGDIFDKVVPPGYQTPANPVVPKPLPAGPVAPTRAELNPPTWNDPLRGGAVPVSGSQP